jgi:hypothetical protein
MNPIEELFAEIKTYIKQQRHNHANLFENDFETFLRMCVDMWGLGLRALKVIFVILAFPSSTLLSTLPNSGNRLLHN